MNPYRIGRAVHPGGHRAGAGVRPAVFSPGGAGPLQKSSVCMFTNTRDEHFIIDRLPGAPQVHLVSACSGHGFKFTSVMGEIAADLVQHGGTAHDISLHRLTRLTA